MRELNDVLSKINFRRIFRYGVYMFVVLIVQNMIFTQIRPMGVCPMILPAAAIAVGMFEGVAWGTVFGVIMGIFADMAFIENTITFTVLFPILAFAAGFIAHFYINKRFFAFMGAVFVGVMTAAVVQMIKTAAIDGWAGDMIGVVIMQTLWSLPPAALTYFPPAKWAKDKL